MASRYLQHISQQLDVTGSGVITSDRIQSWSRLSIALQSQSAAAQWQIGIGVGNPSSYIPSSAAIVHQFGTAFGSFARLGPIEVGPGEFLIVVITNGTKNDLVKGSIFGIQELLPTQLEGLVTVGSSVNLSAAEIVGNLTIVGLAATSTSQTLSIPIPANEPWVRINPIVINGAPTVAAYGITGDQTGLLYLNINAALPDSAPIIPYEVLITEPIDTSCTLTVTLQIGVGTLQVQVSTAAIPGPTASPLSPVLPVYPPYGKLAAFSLLSRAVNTYQFGCPTQLGTKGIIVYFRVTAGTGTVTITIFDTDSGAIAASLLVSAALANPSSGALRVYPGATVVANVVASAPVGSNPMIQAVVATAPVTFQIDYERVA